MEKVLYTICYGLSGFLALSTVGVFLEDLNHKRPSDIPGLIALAGLCVFFFWFARRTQRKSADAVGRDAQGMTCDEPDKDDGIVKDDEPEKDDNEPDKNDL